jgi:MFS family permease
MKTRLPGTVVWLGVVSLATDASAEMIFPLLPLFLLQLGAGPRYLGAIEGAAEAVASLLKLVSGRIADRARRRKSLTVFGYAISSIARPLAGLATAAWMILVVRLCDRIGKGLRSSPRDALLADVVEPEQRGRAYGFHRGMDNAGAVIGPAIAAGLLFLGLSLKTVFLLAAIPAALAMLSLIFGVRENEREDVSVNVNAPVDGERAFFGGAFWRYLLCVALFTLGNAADAFLLLRARELGVTATLIPIIWLVHNAVRAALSTTGGALSDRLGRRRMIITGWLLYALVYLGFAHASAAWHAWALLVGYGIYYALVEGGEKALVADLAPKRARGRAFGLFHAVVGLGALPASFGFGLLAERYGARLPFSVAAGLALAAATLLLTAVKEPRRA